MQSREKTPVTVITGFLGAGKTSLIRHLIEHADGRRLAFIINEFGDLGIDGEILRGCGIEDCSDDDVIELANGCICCTVADDFVPTLETLLDRENPPDHILIETSGLALPKPLLKAFHWPAVKSRATVDGVVTVVDGPAVAAGQFASDPKAVQAQREADDMLDHDSPLEELYEDQLACADVVLVSKSDLMNDADRERVLAQVKAGLGGRVTPLSIADGKINPEVVLGLARAAEDDLDARPSHHDLEDDHDHDDFDSFVLDLPILADADSAERVAHSLLSTDGILRVKGFAAIEGKAARLVVQGVGSRVAHYYDRPWKDGEPVATRLVVIGLHGFDHDALRATATASLN